MHEQLAGEAREGASLRGFAEASFDHVQELDEQGLVDRVLSTSYVATAPAGRQRDIETKLRELAAAGLVRLPYVTRALVTRRR